MGRDVLESHPYVAQVVGRSGAESGGVEGADGVSGKGAVALKRDLAARRRQTALRGTDPVDRDEGSRPYVVWAVNRSDTDSADAVVNRWRVAKGRW